MDSLGQCLLHILLYQQVYGLRTVLHASAGIDTRSYLEDDIAHGEFTTCQSANLDDSLQTHRWVLVQLLQSVEGHDAVLARHGYDICGDTYGTEVE